MWALGLYRLCPTDGEHPTDFIPADHVINACLLAVVASAQEKIPFKVYNCGSSVLNPLNFKDYIGALRPVIEGYETKMKD